MTQPRAIPSKMRVAWRRAARVLGVALCLGLLLLAGPSLIGLALGGVGVQRYPPEEAVLLGTDGVVLQQAKADCGVAALVMMLQSYHRAATYAGLKARVPADARAGDGLSLAALAAIAESVGLPLDGYRRDALHAVPVAPPWIARLGPGSRGHYVVVDSLTPARVVLRDPAVGRLALPRGAFEEFWSGYVLVPRRQAPDGRVLSGLIEP